MRGEPDRRRRDVSVLGKRIVRAKRTIADAHSPYRVQADDELHGVLRVVYVIFNEGYVATEGESPGARGALPNGVGTGCGEECLEACPNRASCCDVLLRQLERRWQ